MQQRLRLQIGRGHICCTRCSASQGSVGNVRRSAGSLLVLRLDRNLRICLLRQEECFLDFGGEVFDGGWAGGLVRMVVLGLFGRGSTWSSRKRRLVCCSRRTSQTIGRIGGMFVLLLRFGRLRLLRVDRGVKVRGRRAGLAMVSGK